MSKLNTLLGVLPPDLAEKLAQPGPAREEALKDNYDVDLTDLNTQVVDVVKEIAALLQEEAA